MGLGCRVRKLRSVIQRGVWGVQPPSLVQSVHISRGYHGNGTMAREGAWDCMKVVTPYQIVPVQGCNNIHVVIN